MKEPNLLEPFAIVPDLPHEVRRVVARLLGAGRPLGRRCRQPITQRDAVRSSGPREQLPSSGDHSSEPTPHFYRCASAPSLGPTLLRTDCRVSTDVDAGPALGVGFNLADDLPNYWRRVPAAEEQVAHQVCHWRSFGPFEEAVRAYPGRVA